MEQVIGTIRLIKYMKDGKEYTQKLITVPKKSELTHGDKVELVPINITRKY